jgi:hypothetical protein
VADFITSCSKFESLTWVTFSSAIGPFLLARAFSRAF